MRQASLTRQTHETNITASVDLDGRGLVSADTGIGFLDHMLTLLARHGRLDLQIKAAGDLVTDDHHTAEDVGIVLGQALGQALGDKRGIRRYGQAMIPMDEALVSAALDLSGRPWLHFEASFTSDRVGTFSTQMTAEFFRALAFNAGMTLHLRCLYGSNDHHIIEAMFKAFARCLAEAAAPDSRYAGEVPSTKGVL